MKKRFGILVLALLWLIPSAFAQRRVVKFGKKARAVRPLESPLLKNVSKQVRATYGHKLYALTEPALSAKSYPELALKNRALTQQALKLFEKQAQLFANNAQAIADNIESRVYTRVPYETLLPKEVDVLYIGEIHGVPRLQGEIKSLIQSLRKVYPERKIYLAAESVPAAFDLDFSMDDLIFTKEDLQNRLEEDDIMDMESVEGGGATAREVVLAALNEGIAVLGLESFGALFQFVTPVGREYATEEELGDVATSFVGMEFRNEGFAKGINMLRKADPQALVVVYGGFLHFAYHQLSSLPSLVEGKSFVVQMSVPSALHSSNLLFQHFKEKSEIRQAFHASPEAKLVESWKSPTSFNQILGNDLTIIVHE